MAKLTQVDFTSSRIATGKVRAGDVLANPDNPTMVTGGQKKALVASFGELQSVKAIMINLRHSEEWPVGQRDVPTLLDGHKRVELALEEVGENCELDADFFDFTPEQERLALLLLDPSVALAAPDVSAYSKLLALTDSRNQATREALEIVSRNLGVLAAMPKPASIEDADIAGGGASAEDFTYRVTVPKRHLQDFLGFLDGYRAKGVEWERIDE